jgi:hypothetical protein
MKRALMIGIDRYQYPGNDLSGCVNDINLINSILQMQFGYECDYLLNSQATGGAMRQKIKELMLSGKDKDDQLLLYYSGHGSRVRDRNGDEADGWDECLCPHDSPDDAIIDDTLWDLFQLKKEEVQLQVVFDCCHSGTGHRSIKGGTDKIRSLCLHESQYVRKIKDVLTEKGCRNLTFVGACGDLEYAREVQTDAGVVHGVFTHALSEIIRYQQEFLLTRGMMEDIQGIIDDLGIIQHPEIHIYR